MWSFRWSKAETSDLLQCGNKDVEGVVGEPAGEDRRRADALLLVPDVYRLNLAAGVPPTLIPLVLVNLKGRCARANKLGSIGRINKAMRAKARRADGVLVRVGNLQGIARRHCGAGGLLDVVFGSIRHDHSPEKSPPQAVEL